MDVIIILGAVIGRDGHPGRVARFRLTHALPVTVESFPDSWVVISGGFLPGRPVSEAKAMGDWMVRQAFGKMGGSESRKLEQRLLPDEISMNTAATAFNSALLMQERGLKNRRIDSRHIAYAPSGISL